MKVSFPYNQPVSFYDPQKIYLSPEYTFLENIYSTLIQKDTDGTLKPSVADDFFWNGNHAHFKIKNDLKTKDGHTIDAFDVEVTLKRNLILGGNTHGNLKAMLCPDVQLKDLDSDCRSIQVIRDRNEIVLKFTEPKFYLFSMLTGMDFAIIPRASLDPISLKIIDYRQTSGPYYVDADHGNGNIHLSANPNHFHYSKDMPLQVILVPTCNSSLDESIRLFSDNKIDLITTIDQAPHEEILKYAQKNEVSVHVTDPLRSFMIHFTKKGLSRFSIAQRLAFAKKLKQNLLELFNDRLRYESLNSIFPNLAFCSLSAEQSSAIENLISSLPESEFSSPMVGAMLRCPQIDPCSPILIRKLPQVKFYVTDQHPGFANERRAENLHDDELDFYIAGTDMGMTEDVGLISYAANAGFFDLNGKTPRDWLLNYLDERDPNTRKEVLIDLHYATIVNAVTVPLMISPYVSMAKKNWKFNHSTIFASDAIWRMRQQ